MMQLAEKERFVISFSYHTYATKILTPYTVTTATSPLPNPGWTLAEKLISVMKSHRRDGPYKTQRNLYPVDGNDQDWLHFKFGTLAFIMEGSYHSPRYEPEGRLSIQGMRPAALRAMDLFSKGPVITIQTVDPSHRPIGDVSVRLAQTTFYENENYTTHSATGRYDFFLESGGTYDVIAEKKGYKTAKIKIDCLKSHCHKQILLTRL